MIDYRRGQLSGCRVQKEKTAPCTLYPVPLLMLTILISLGMAALPGKAISKDLKTIVSEIQKRYDSIETLQIAFSQEVVLKGREGGLEVSGVAFFRKPGMMKWDYITPEKQQIISNGETLWIYRPNFNQVMISRLPEDKNVVKDFLSGMGRLDKDFSIELIKEDEYLYLLGLNPRIPQASTERLLMKVGKNSSMVQEITSYDFMGNATTIKLKDIEINIPLSLSLFTFKIPDGTKVVTPDPPF
ncbi:MAG: outer membrane lipoprotein chaperone LolA [Thermodesulfobacteriota bacterium]